MRRILSIIAIACFLCLTIGVMPVLASKESDSKIPQERNFDSKSFETYIPDAQVSGESQIVEERESEDGQGSQVMYQQSKELEKVLIVCRKSKEIDFLNELVCSMELEPVILYEENYENSALNGVSVVLTTSKNPIADAKEKGIPFIALGSYFGDFLDAKVKEYDSASIALQSGVFQEMEQLEKNCVVIDEFEGQTIGNVLISSEYQVPFCVTKNKQFYIPFYREEGLSMFMLADVIKQAANQHFEGEMYVLLDEIYPFSDLNALCETAELLYDNAIPFIVRIMPVYDNLEYPSFKKYAEVLRFVQAKNGSIVIHEPLVREGESIREPLEVRMKRFEDALKAEDIHYFPFQSKPFLVEWNFIYQLNCTTKDFGKISMDAMFPMSIELSTEERETYISQINERWMRIGDYKRKYTEANFIYVPTEIATNFQYVEQEQAKYQDFFAKGNEILIILVAFFLVVFTGFILIGRKWYRRKFLK